MTYVEELEKQNEELRQLLAVHQDTMPRWHDFTDDPRADVVEYAYILDNRVFGIINSSYNYKRAFYAKTAKNTIDGDSVDELKKMVEQEYINTFLAVFKP